MFVTVRRTASSRAARGERGKSRGGVLSGFRCVMKFLRAHASAGAQRPGVVNVACGEVLAASVTWRDSTPRITRARAVALDRHGQGCPAAATAVECAQGERRPTRPKDWNGGSSNVGEVKAPRCGAFSGLWPQRRAGVAHCQVCQSRRPRP